jgi:malate dehydrogenase
MKAPLRIAITGAAGNIGYALTFRLASGEVFGADLPVILHLVEVPPVVKSLDGIEMELEDCAFPTLAGVKKASSDNLEDAFAGCNWVLLVGRRRQGDPVGRRQGRPHARRRQPVQYELPDRDAQRAERPARPLVCDDDAR